MTEGNRRRLRNIVIEIEDLLKHPKDTQHAVLVIMMLQEKFHVVLNDLIFRPEVNEHERPV